MTIAMTTAKTCGCHMEPVDDDNEQPSDLCSEATGGAPGQGWSIAYCSLHAAAPALLAALQCALACLARANAEQRNAREATQIV